MELSRTICLAIGLLLSLVLPLAANAWQAGAGAGGRKTYLMTVGAGQAGLAASGVWILAAPVWPELGVLAAVMICFVGVSVLRRQTRLA